MDPLLDDTKMCEHPVNQSNFLNNNYRHYNTNNNNKSPQSKKEQNK